MGHMDVRGKRKRAYKLWRRQKTNHDPNAMCIGSGRAGRVRNVGDKQPFELCFYVAPNGVAFAGLGCAWDRVKRAEYSASCDWEFPYDVVCRTRVCRGTEKLGWDRVANPDFSLT